MKVEKQFVVRYRDSHGTPTDLTIRFVKNDFWRWYVHVDPVDQRKGKAAFGSNKWFLRSVVREAIAKADEMEVNWSRFYQHPAAGQKPNDATHDKS
jgi:hypothetical protein